MLPKQMFPITFKEDGNGPKAIVLSTTESQQENRKTLCEILHQRHSIVHQIVTGDEKWIHYDNPKRLKAYGCRHVNQVHRHQNAIFMVLRLCCESGGTNLV